ncbi:FAD-dependent oxidoreductase [Halobaculum limi]|uniref:FAD-dependent oxidoreductase n=1 Tax=Halobaculum limi TaxID=3031916 RepID=UPI0024060E86|nr:FAD-dependent oxidoreductase [Halobaculum sp. YSMS11]
MTDPVVVVGGDAAGLSAASKLTREDPEREVIVFERGAWVSYAHCGIPYYVKGEVDDLTDLLSLRPEDVDDRGIDLRRRHEVTAVDTDAHTVTVEGPDGSFEQSYGNLLVATGASAVSDPIPGSELDGAFTIHGLDSAATVRAAVTPPEEFSLEALGGGSFVDAERARYYGERPAPDRVAIVGGGYVGVEMAEAFAAWDVETHLFQRSQRLLPAFGDAVAETVESHLEEMGVHLHMGTPVDRLTGTDGNVTGLVCTDGTELSIGLAVVGIGVRPNVDLLRDTPVELGDSGAVAVDEYGQTNVDEVYAAGDCAEDRHAVTGEPAWVPLGLTANRAGRAIGQTLAGTPTPVGDIAGTAVVKAFEQECGRTGIIDAEEARDAGFDPVSRTITAGSRSGYYPGNSETTVTLVADRDSGRLLGGSIVGEDRAAIRIDTVATALESGLTVAEVERLDLAYAPPFSPVWDPVLVAAKVLNGALNE